MGESLFDLNPQSRPVAIIEIVFLLILAAAVGWVVARILFNNRIDTLRTQIAEKEAELDECRKAKVQASPKKTAGHEAAGLTQSVFSSGKPVWPTQQSDLQGQSTQDQAEPIHIPASSEAAVLARITSRATELNFDRIGWATPAQADDLKDIVGIGPLLERKLHSLGIYTYRQIANFTAEDMIKVNEIIEFFPGRIERDNWVGQAKAIYERKYGTKL